MPPGPTAESFVPASLQPRLPIERLILHETPRADVALDVVFVGGGPAGLAGAIALARLARDAPAGSALRGIEIGVLEKGDQLGDHCLSGAILNPVALRALFPDLDDSDLPLGTPVERERVYALTAGRSIRVPTPPQMRNRGNFVISICELVRWLGARAVELGVYVMTGFPAASLLVEGRRVAGVRTAVAGLDRDGQPGGSYLPASDVLARVTVLSEGGRGALTQAWLEWQGIRSANPQIHALGVKELWRTQRPLDAVVHSVGWPLAGDTFGGSFVYPLTPEHIALGLVAGLDSPDPRFDVHERLQELKQHPLLRRYLADGELLEWGAKTIPEGGFYSIPDRLAGDGLMIVGDSAGLVDVPSLKGIHYAMQSGILAAQAIATALEAKATSAEQLQAYDVALRRSFVWRDLERSRNVRLAYTRGFWQGTALAGLMTLTGGRFPGKRIEVRADADVRRRRASAAPPAARAGIRKVDAVYLSGNSTRDDQPSHLLRPQSVPEAAGRFYESMCPAAVYEWIEGELVIHPSNCIDCKTTDVLGPRWLPREGGSGPQYRRM